MKHKRTVFRNERDETRKCKLCKGTGCSISSDTENVYTCLYCRGKGYRNTYYGIDKKE